MDGDSRPVPFRQKYPNNEARQQKTMQLLTVNTTTDITETTESEDPEAQPDDTFRTHCIAAPVSTTIGAVPPTGTQQPSTTNAVLPWAALRNAGTMQHIIRVRRCGVVSVGHR